MSFGLGVLRLSPEHFWKLTPLELAALARGRRPSGRAPDRAALDGLIRAFPDQGPASGGGAVEAAAFSTGAVGFAAGRAGRTEAIDPMAAHPPEGKTLGFHAGDEEPVVDVRTTRPEFHAGDVVAAGAAGRREGGVASAATVEVDRRSVIDDGASGRGPDEGEHDGVPDAPESRGCENPGERNAGI